MPGVSGVACQTSAAGLTDLVAGMARRVRHHPWYVESRYIDESDGLGLGRTTLAWVNAAAQPAHNEDRTWLAVLEGEVLDYERHRHALEVTGQRFAGDSHAELLIHGFRAQGPAF